MESKRVDNPISKARTEVPEREINVGKKDLWDIQVHIQMISIKI